MITSPAPRLLDTRGKEGSNVNVLRCGNGTLTVTKTREIQ